MKKSLIWLILCGLLMPLVISFVAPVFFFATMITSSLLAKNQVKDLELVASQKTIQHLRSSIFQLDDELDTIKNSATRAYYRNVSFPTFTGSYGVDYLSYSVLATSFEREVERWQQTIASKPIAGGVISEPRENWEDPPSWWLNENRNAKYLGSFGFVSRTAMGPLRHSVWVDRESSIIYVYFFWGH